MSPIDASTLLRPGLLEGVSVLLAGAHGPAERDHPAGAAVHAACAALGASVSARLGASQLAPGSDDVASEREVERVLAERGSLELLVLDGAGLFAYALGSSRAGEDERASAALRACLAGAWSVTRAVMNGAFLAQGHGRVLYIAPSSRAGEHADGARAGLENLARTLSVEWARHAVTLVAIAPGAASSADEVAALTAYLASPAGAYFSGCELQLR
jgi:NAD(P)-dependent dehydrogenase (short-subunit alcohol dehydrogenase family)